MSQRRAVLIGINYKGTESELNGCINDVRSIYNMLLSRGWKNEEISVLSEEHDILPTKANCIEYIKKLADMPDGSTLFLHISSHGSWFYDQYKKGSINNGNRSSKRRSAKKNRPQKGCDCSSCNRMRRRRRRNRNHRRRNKRNGGGDELDGRDECFVPLDYETEGCILDDDLREMLMMKVPENSKLFCLFDCCHSATLGDLRYVVRSEAKRYGIDDKMNALYYKYYEWTGDMIVTTHPYDKTVGNICTVSGCEDIAYSADAYIDGKYQGALTSTFLSVLSDNEFNIKYKHLIKDINCRLILNNYEQRPQMCFGNWHDLNQKFDYL